MNANDMTKQWLEGVRLLPFLQSEILNLLQIKPKDGARSCPGDLESWNLHLNRKTVMKQVTASVMNIRKE